MARLARSQTPDDERFRLPVHPTHARRGRQGWRGINNPWMAGGDDGEDYLYINLLTNPERYTGYKVGRMGAWRWEAAVACGRWGCTGVPLPLCAACARPAQRLTCATPFRHPLPPTHAHARTNHPHSDATHAPRASTRTVSGLPSTTPSPALRARPASASRRACSGASSVACTAAYRRT